MPTNFKERQKTNKILLVFYVLFVIVAPLVILLIGFDINTVDFYKSKAVKSIAYFTFLLVSAPAYGFYGYLMLKSHFPINNWRALSLFISLLSTTLFYIFSDTNSLFEVLMSDSLPLYLGLNTMFFVGLLILFKKNLEGASDVVARLIAIPIVLLILFFPVYYMYIVGYQLSTKYSQTDTEMLSDILKFFSSIALVIFFHFKTLIRMYENGNL